MWTIQDFEIGALVGTGGYGIVSKRKWYEGKVYLAREKCSKFVVAIKAVEMKVVVRAGIVDLLQNEIDIQTHLRSQFSNPLNVDIKTCCRCMDTFGMITASTWFKNTAFMATYRRNYGGRESLQNARQLGISRGLLKDSNTCMIIKSFIEISKQRIFWLEKK